MAHHEHLPIFKAALDMTVRLEKLVAGFSRYHKHTLGAELRKGSRAVLQQVQRPKLREIFAADFRDCVVHHVLVNYLEGIWEPVFIHGSYACRKGKGVHAAVARLQQFMREATANGTRPAYTLQLDIHSLK